MLQKVEVQTTVLSTDIPGAGEQKAEKGEETLAQVRLVLHNREIEIIGNFRKDRVENVTVKSSRGRKILPLEEYIPLPRGPGRGVPESLGG